jgi:IS1 family transposase
MRKLSAEQRAAILNCLVEGMSIRATCRLTGAAKVTVLRLLADVGRLCTDHHDRTVRNIAARFIQCDEAWGFVGCKDRALKHGAQGHGSAWVWIAQDADTKLVLSYFVGDRSFQSGSVLLRDLSSRVVGRPQISTDGLSVYRGGVRFAFAGNVDHGTVNKVYASAPIADARRYSPPICVGCEKQSMHGAPDMDNVSTSYIERQNRDLRMRCRRMTRLTDAFSKTIENHASAMALHYWAHNFLRKHGTLKTTPAVAAGIADRPLTTLDLAQMLEAEEAERGGRITSYLASS